VAFATQSPENLTEHVIAEPDDWRMAKWMDVAPSCTSGVVIVMAVVSVLATGSRMSSARIVPAPPAEVEMMAPRFPVAFVEKITISENWYTPAVGVFMYIAVDEAYIDPAFGDADPHAPVGVTNPEPDATDTLPSTVNRGRASFNQRRLSDT
jgi:hypothetical protein